MEPLSTFKYVRNNLNKIAAQVISISLGVAVIYFLFAFGGGFLKNINRLIDAPLKDKAIYTANKSSTTDLRKCYNQVKNTKGVEKILDASMNFTEMKTALGTIGCRAVGLKKADIDYMFKKENYKLTEGRMPEKDGEILANEDYAKSKGYKINQYIGNDVDSTENIEGKKKVVGLFKSNEIIVYYVDESLEKQEDGKGFLAIYNNPQALKAVNEKYNKKISVIDVSFFNTFFKSFKSAFIAFGILIVCVILAIEWIILNNLLYINLLSRKESLALMCAVGMGKKEVKNRILKEQGAVIIMGFVFGIIIGILGVASLNFAYLNPNGQKISLFNPMYLSGSICLSIIVFLTSRLPLRKFFKKTDIVSILEGR